MDTIYSFRVVSTKAGQDHIPFAATVMEMTDEGGPM
jgi:hypothetical protein